MAYNLDQIAVLAKNQIAANPGIKASELAAALKISRRTLARALRS